MNNEETTLYADTEENNDDEEGGCSCSTIDNELSDKANKGGNSGLFMILAVLVVGLIQLRIEKKYGSETATVRKIERIEA